MSGLRGRLALRLTRDKSDTLLLLAAALMVLAPHFAHLPLWISALSGAGRVVSSRSNHSSNAIRALRIGSM